MMLTVPMVMDTTVMITLMKLMFVLQIGGS